MAFWLCKNKDGESWRGFKGYTLVRLFRFRNVIPSEAKQAHEIATPCVPKLHTTKNPCVQALRRAGTSSREIGTPRNDRVWSFEVNYFMLPSMIFEDEISWMKLSG